MVLGVFSAALANGQFAGREVAYIVGLGSSGTVAALLYFSIAFGKVTISTLNSYGSFMCIATIISSVRGQLEITRLQRLFFVLVIVGASTLIAARPALVPRCVQVLHPVPADLLHPVERGEPGRLLLHHPRAL